MQWRKQVKNFLRVLISGAPNPESSCVDPLARTASDLRIMSMSVEDDRLASSERNSAYVKSLEDS